jgi:hypothetical protein
MEREIVQRVTFQGGYPVPEKTSAEYNLEWLGLG